MKKVVLFLVGSMFMVSCGEKEMTPQEKELLEVTNQIELYQTKSDSLKTLMYETQDSIITSILGLPQGTDYRSINMNGEISDDRILDVTMVAWSDFEVTMLEVEADFWAEQVAKKKQEQLRLATLVAALK